MLPVLAATGRAGFSPRRVPGLRLWLDAGRIVGLADGAGVATWPDSSGRGNDASQANPAKQPVYRAGVVNGRPAVRFDGVDDRLELATGMGMLRNRAGAGVAAVVRYNAVGDNVVLFIATALGGTRVHLASNPGSLRLSYRRLDGDALAEVAGGAYDLVSAQVQVGVADLAGGAVRLFKNGSLIGGPQPCAAGNTSDTDSSGVYVGAGPGGASSAADVAEIAVYDRALSTAERRHVERYLGWKYGVAVG